MKMKHDSGYNSSYADKGLHQKPLCCVGWYHVLLHCCIMFCCIAFLVGESVVRACVFELFVTPWATKGG